MTPRSTSSLGSLYGRGRVFALISLFLVLVTLLAACGTTSNSNTAKQGGTLTMVPGPIGDYTRNFNVFANGSVLNGTQGLIYETLLFFNREDGSVKPWLASSYQFSSDAASITFKLRPNVQWSDGKPFTSADVVFTLNLIRDHPAIDYSGLWTVITSVSAPDDHTVIVKLKQPSVPILWYLGGQTYMIPQHLWSSVTIRLRTRTLTLSALDPSCSSLSRHSCTFLTAILISGSRASRPSTKYVTLPSTQIRALACCFHKARSTGLVCLPRTSIQRLRTVTRCIIITGSRQTTSWHSTRTSRSLLLTCSRCVKPSAPPLIVTSSTRLARTDTNRLLTPQH